MQAEARMTRASRAELQRLGLVLSVMGKYERVTF